MKNNRGIKNTVHRVAQGLESCLCLLKIKTVFGTIVLPQPIKIQFESFHLEQAYTQDTPTGKASYVNVFAGFAAVFSSRRAIWHE
jgi:hypothetical protein